MATFNGAEFLDEQLDSLVAQTQLPDELVVVDDASTDGTQELLRAFARRAPFPVQVVEQPSHVGTSPNFEEGIVRSSGDLISIADQDDRWCPDKIAVMANRMAREPEVLMAFSDAVLIDAAGHRIGGSRWRVSGFSPSVWRQMALDPFGPMLGRQVVSGCTMVFRRALVPAIVPIPAGLHPALGNIMYDRWISLLAAAVGPVMTVPERLIEYRIHPGQQIGIPAFRLRRSTPRLALHTGQFVANHEEKEGRAEYYLAHVHEISKRLEALHLDSGDSNLRLHLGAQHLTARIAIVHDRRGRARAISRQYRDPDGYRRFALGLATALADFVR
ncbi:MAG: glycosyltransferase family 2 protein [Actinomycetes bacterium]